MGIFYNKNLLREVPKTWNDLDILYEDGIEEDVFVSNLGLGPRYTTNATDILGLFL
jgi:maltose-binding protein MalE